MFIFEAKFAILLVGYDGYVWGVTRAFRHIELFGLNPAKHCSNLLQSMVK
jgi:hypothetical protein